MFVELRPFGGPIAMRTDCTPGPTSITRAVAVAVALDAPTTTRDGTIENPATNGFVGNDDVTVALPFTPSTLAMMIDVPVCVSAVPTAETTPDGVTVATSGAVETHASVLPVIVRPAESVTVAAYVCVPPTGMRAVAGESTMRATGPGVADGLLGAVLPPSEELAHAVSARVTAARMKREITISSSKAETDQI